MRRCAPPGASRRRLGSTASPALASTTFKREEPSRRVASEAVKPGGMCWTMTEPEPSGAGSFGISSPRAFRPPVEDAIITNFLPPERGGRAGSGTRRGGLVDERGDLGGRRGGRQAAARVRLAAVGGVVDLAGEILGELVHRLTHRRLGDEVERALGQRVDRAGAVGGENADTTMTGTLVALPALSARSTPRPSRPGMCRSRVIASGRCSLQAASASSPLAAPATTSKPWRERASERMRRIRRESSATTTRTQALELGRLATGPGTTRRRARQRRCRRRPSGLRRITRRSPIFGDRLDGLQVGGRDGLELLGRDREDLLDVADDDAGLAGARLDDDDLAELGVAGIDADARGQVVDRDDLAAEADHAADPRHVEATERGSEKRMISWTEPIGRAYSSDPRLKTTSCWEVVSDMSLCAIGQTGRGERGSDRSGGGPGTALRSGRRGRRAGVRGVTLP